MEQDITEISEKAKMYRETLEREKSYLKDIKIKDRMIRERVYDIFQSLDTGVRIVWNKKH